MPYWLYMLPVVAVNVCASLLLKTGAGQKSGPAALQFHELALVFGAMLFRPWGPRLRMAFALCAAWRGPGRSRLAICFTVLGAHFLLHERMDGVQIAGFVLIGIGIACVVSRQGALRPAFATKLVAKALQGFCVLRPRLRYPARECGARALFGLKAGVSNHKGTCGMKDKILTIAASFLFIILVIFYFVWLSPLMCPTTLFSAAKSLRAMPSFMAARKFNGPAPHACGFNSPGL